MKGTTAAKRAARRALRLDHLRNEEGMLLVLTMVIFLVLSSLAATNIINAYLERSLADNHHYATLSLNAADAGIDHGIAWLVGNPGAIDYSDPTWSEDDPDADGDPNVDGSFDLDGDGVDDVTYDIVVAIKADEDDLDSDGTCTDIVYFTASDCAGGKCCPGDDGCFGFPDAVFKNAAGAGTPPFPVIEITAVGTYGDAGSRTVSLEIARNGLNVGVYGAVTGTSSLSTGGNILVDGRGHDESWVLCTDAGSSCTCTDGYPGITLPCPSGDLNGDGDCADTGIGETGIDSTISGSTDVDGDPANKGFLEDYSGTTPNTPDEVLGMSPGDLAGMIGTPPVDGYKEGIKLTWYNKDIRLQDDHQDRFANNDDSFGVVVVHNPNFDPHVWDVSIQTGDPGSGYDPTHADYDPTIDINNGLYDQNEYDDKAPRTVDLNSNATFKGVVIADVIDRINGTADVIGAVYSLSRVEFGTLGNGSAGIMFSCDAINSYTTQAYSTKLAWHRRF